MIIHHPRVGVQPGANQSRRKSGAWLGRKHWLFQHPGALMFGFRLWGGIPHRAKSCSSIILVVVLSLVGGGGQRGRVIADSVPAQGIATTLRGSGMGFCLPGLCFRHLSKAAVPSRLAPAARRLVGGHALGGGRESRKRHSSAILMEEMRPQPTEKLNYPMMAFDFETVAMPQNEDYAEVMNVKSCFEALKQEALNFESSPLLAHQMQKHIINRDNLYHALASVLASKLANEDLPENLLFDKLSEILQNTPKIMSDMVHDLLWIQQIDPATHGLLQPFLYFKGFHAVQVQRMGHNLWTKNNPVDKMLALSLQSRAAEVFGVDAHPGAVIAHAICLDHATGVVIGETGTIGHNCYILHGVTLGATGKAGTFDRHPKVGNHVKIGAGAMILGNIALGDDVVVGAAAIVTIPVKKGETVVGINRVLSKELKKAATDSEKDEDTWLYEI